MAALNLTEGFVWMSFCTGFWGNSILCWGDVVSVGLLGSPQWLCSERKEISFLYKS